MDGKRRQSRNIRGNAVHIVYAAEKVRDDNLDVAPDVTESFDDVSVVAPDALIHMKLISYRRIDQVHLLDMIDVGLLDASWLPRFPPPWQHGCGNCWTIRTDEPLRGSRHRSQGTMTRTSYAEPAHPPARLSACFHSQIDLTIQDAPTDRPVCEEDKSVS